MNTTLQGSSPGEKTLTPDVLQAGQSQWPASLTLNPSFPPLESVAALQRSTSRRVVSIAVDFNEGARVLVASTFLGGPLCLGLRKSTGKSTFHARKRLPCSPRLSASSLVRCLRQRKPWRDPHTWQVGAWYPQWNHGGSRKPISP